MSNEATNYLIDTYRLRFDTPTGTFDVELIGSSLEIATKRATWSLVAGGYGDPDDIVLVGYERTEGVVPR
jgi:hypothetical protein